MKKSGLLHPELSHVIASLGHTDTLVIADAGLPIPEGVARIDLAYRAGEPPFLSVLEAILAEMEVAGATLALEIQDLTPKTFYKKVLGRLEQLPKVKKQGVDFISHEDFKAQTLRAKAVIRTGEMTPYANVILESGTIF
ncbi:MAG: D-ribose pyranase [Trueperaceae bacterium]